MKILQINIFGNLSTGRIAVDLYRTILENGHSSKIAFARNEIPKDIEHIKIGNKLDVTIHGVLTRITDRAGFYSTLATQRLIKEIYAYNPDIVHLHNVHGYYVNVDILFSYLKVNQIPTIWTLHDCWSYTGHCCYYSMAKCEKWKSHCEKCPQIKSYPSSMFIDNSYDNYEKKRALFTGLNMTLVPVSYWLGDEVKKSFLSNYPIKVIQNGIDLKSFKPTTGKFRELHGLKEKKIVLGVASTWDVRKGFEDFLELAKHIDPDFHIVLVGLDKKKISMLPKNILGLERTDSIEQLAEIYTCADVFFNASVEETFGLPSVEAMACGTPCVVYNETALPEVINDDVGVVVSAHDISGVVAAIKKAIQIKDRNKIIEHAHKYDKDLKFKEYISLYQEIIEQKS